MNGNITKEGIDLDLQWMHRVGLRGYQNFDAALETPQVVEKRLAYMTPDWKDAFKHAIVTGDQLGMEMAIAGSPGWSESGGPWVPASEGMKKYVWSATLVKGGKPFSGVLAHPPSNSGAFQNRGINDQPTPGAAPIPNFYKDTVVVAYKRPAVDKDLEELHPKITASGGSPDFAMLSDGDLEKTTKLPIPAEGQASWIQYEFPQAQAVRAVTFVTKDPDMIASLLAGMGAPDKTLEASDDGQNFHEVAKLNGDDAPEHTLSFPAATAKYFRILFKRTPPPPIPEWAQAMDPESFGIKIPPKPTDFDLAEMVLHPGARVNQFEIRRLSSPLTTSTSMRPRVAPDEAIAKSDVVDLTARMTADGKLDWTPPEGDWVVLRFGYSLLGISNHPATAEATGLGSRQDGPALCEELFREISRQLQRDRRSGPDGQAGHHAM